MRGTNIPILEKHFRVTTIIKATTIIHFVPASFYTWNLNQQVFKEGINKEHFLKDKY